MFEPIYENTTTEFPEHTKLSYPERMEAVTECNACDYYRRGECGLSGLDMAPDDYCSKAVPAEA